MESNNRAFVTVISLLFIAAGIVLMLVPIATVETIAFILGIVLALSGVLRVLQFLFTRHNNLDITLNTLVIGILCAVIGIVLILNPFFADILLEKIIAAWMILMGLIKLIISYTYKKAKEKQWIGTLIASLISIVIGIIIWRSFAAWEFVLGVLIPIYFIVLGASSLFNVALDRATDRARVPLPLWMEAFFPQKALKSVKETLASGNTENISPDSVYIHGMKMSTDDIEVFVHMSERSASAFGHVDIGMGDYVLSYGNYDHSKEAISLFGLLYDGIFFVCPRKKYIEFSVSEAGKTIMGYKLALSNEAQEQIARNVRAFFENCAPWQIKETDRKINDYSWAIKDMGGELYKVTSGKFKTYFVLNTNCALLSEVLLDKTGIPKSRAFGGAVTPGSAYALYERELAKKNSFVISKRSYLNDDMLKELSENERIKTEPTS
ncbi:MAG: DUF308 domain-containing protein [Christensenella sp.]